MPEYLPKPTRSQAKPVPAQWSVTVDTDLLLAVAGPNPSWPDSYSVGARSQVRGDRACRRIVHGRRRVEKVAAGRCSRVCRCLLRRRRHQGQARQQGRVCGSVEGQGVVVCRRVVVPAVDHRLADREHCGRSRVALRQLREVEGEALPVGHVARLGGVRVVGCQNVVGGWGSSGRCLAGDLSAVEGARCHSRSQEVLERGVVGVYSLPSPHRDPCRLSHRQELEGVQPSGLGISCGRAHASLRIGANRLALLGEAGSRSRGV